MNRVLFEQSIGEGRCFRLVQGDITAEPTAAIVNAANERLAHGGGVAGAIVRRGGQEIQRQSNAWVRRHGPVSTGSAAITGAGRLPARHVIHAVGPVWGSGDEDAKLASAVRSALQLAVEHQVESISLPAISAGIFGFPLERCARILIEATTTFLQQELPQDVLAEVRICLYDDRAAKTFVQVAQQQLEPQSEVNFHTYPLQRRERAIDDRSLLFEIVAAQRYMTLALCYEGQPYLATVNYGFDPQRACFYFHCARQGKKIDYLRANPLVWGQILEDRGYLDGACDHAYRTVQFRGRAHLVADLEEKRQALHLMIEQLESDPEAAKAEQITSSSLKGVAIVRVETETWSGKQNPAPQEES